MASVFWNSQEITSFDYLKKGWTITGTHYAILMTPVNRDLRTKQPILACKKVVFHMTTHWPRPLKSQWIRMRRPSPLWMSIMKASRLPTFLRGSRNWNTTGPNIWNSKKTILRKKRWIFQKWNFHLFFLPYLSNDPRIVYSFLAQNSYFFVGKLLLYVIFIKNLASDG